jgi:peptidoglycan/LPS O-acetylase OafA/YrhL
MLITASETPGLTAEHAQTKWSFAEFILGGLGRITSSGQFIAEIDGLRFIAIASVVLFHINYYLGGISNSASNIAGESFKHFTNLFQRGALGVELFFVISGFILALPFARHYLCGGRPVPLKQYFLRRITRLEPPYMFAMILCFLLILHHYIGKQEVREYVLSLFASLGYIHNFIWPRGTLPLNNPVAWSLEIEIQFYILAPLIACVFALNAFFRRGLLLVLILSKICFLNTACLPHVSLLDFYDYFLVGFLLADLYLSGRLELSKWKVVYFCAAVASFAVVWFCGFKWLSLEIGLFYYCALKSNVIRSCLQNRWIATIGGMCYSIYLTHWMVITTVGARVVRRFSGSYECDYLIHTAILCGIVLGVGVIYFKLVERPCMAKDWHMRLLGRAKSCVWPVSKVSEQ